MRTSSFTTADHRDRTREAFLLWLIFGLFTGFIAYGVNAAVWFITGMHDVGWVTLFGNGSAFLVAAGLMFGTASAAWNYESRTGRALLVGGSLIMAVASSMIYAALATYLLNAAPDSGATRGQIADFVRVQERAGISSFAYLLSAGLVAGLGAWAIARRENHS